MSDLTEFLLTRVAEDRVAVLSAVADIDLRHHSGYAVERLLAECESKRRIAERCVRAERRATTGNLILSADYIATHDACRDLAAVYADHEDYRDEWRP